METIVLNLLKVLNLKERHAPVKTTIVFPLSLMAKN